MNASGSLSLVKRNGGPSGIVDPEGAREEVLRATRDFKNSWRALAKALHIVWENKLYARWGYEKFDDYTAKEVFVRKHTAMKLIRSYMFLKNEHLDYQGAYSDQENRPESPLKPQDAFSFETVDILQKAKRALPESEYRKVKEDLFEKNKDVNEVKKDLTALILKRRKDVDSEHLRTQRGKVAVNRFLAVLRSFKRDVETLDILPGEIAQDIGRLIVRIEEYAR
ncbi:MAG: hypothetical protein JXD21_01195 [Candidatus Omnitrophica bacterium]|nr:hypothetical protein [Candidatus Omnitrophota bacterium]